MIPSGAKLYLDTNILIHIVEGNPLLQSNVDALLRRIEAGELSTATSELSIAEVLVKPYMTGNTRLAALYEALLVSGPQMVVAPVDLAILKSGARLRALTRAKLPDAIHVATAMALKCDYVVSEDAGMKVLPPLLLAKLSAFQP